MLDEMLKVQNVNRLIFLFMSCLFLSCGVRKDSQRLESSHYEIQKFKCKSRSVTIYAIDTEPPYDTIVSPLIIINNLYFGNLNSFIPGDENNNIEIAFVGKKPIKIKNLKVRRGDSIVINGYLKDDVLH